MSDISKARTFKDKWTTLMETDFDGFLEFMEEEYPLNSVIQIKKPSSNTIQYGLTIIDKEYAGSVEYDDYSLPILTLNENSLSCETLHLDCNADKYVKVIKKFDNPRDALHFLLDLGRDGEAVLKEL